MTSANPNGRVLCAGLLLILVAFAATAQEFRTSTSRALRSVDARFCTRFNRRDAWLNVPTTLDNLRNQPYSVANLGLTKNFRWGEGRRIQLRAEALNAFNHPYFGAGMGLNPGTAAAPNATFGFVTTQRNNPRDIQFGVKFVF